MPIIGRNQYSDTCFRKTILCPSIAIILCSFTRWQSIVFLKQVSKYWLHPIIGSLLYTWNCLGLALGLRQGTLDIIDHDCRSHSEDCFRICLQKWLQEA